MKSNEPIRLVFFVAALAVAGFAAAEDTKWLNGMGPSSPEQIAAIMAVTNKPGYADAYAKIAATVAREAFAMDKQDYTLLAAQYTDDACFETSVDFGDLPAPVQKMLDDGVCGHKKIQDYVALASGNVTRKPGLWNQHVYTNLWLEKLDGDTALARGYVAGLGRIEEHYLRGKDGIWRIKRKKIIAYSFGSAGTLRENNEKAAKKP
jgi:hypothetical protein